MFQNFIIRIIWFFLTDNIYRYMNNYWISINFFAVISTVPCPKSNEISIVDIKSVRNHINYPNENIYEDHVVCLIDRLTIKSKQETSD